MNYLSARQTAEKWGVNVSLPSQFSHLTLDITSIDVLNITALQIANIYFTERTIQYDEFHYPGRISYHASCCGYF